MLALTQAASGAAAVEARLAFYEYNIMLSGWDKVLKFVFMSEIDLP